MAKEYDLEQEHMESQEEREGAGWQTIGLFLVGVALLVYAFLAL